MQLRADDLAARLSVGRLSGEVEALPASVTRRMCCDGSLLPVVLGGRSLPLDLGRSSRLFSTAQRHALAVRDGGCSFPGCDTPPLACNAHHLAEWEAQHGPTSLDNGALLCPYHHRIVHWQGWTGRIAANGRPEYRPPQSIDPHRRWRQDIRYTLDQLLPSRS